MRKIVHIIKRVQELIYLSIDPIGYARSIGVRLGNEVRIINLDLKTFGSEPYLIQIGDHVTIASEVRFITHDGGVWIFRNEKPDIEYFNRIVVGNNVFIGCRSTILPGATIGNNCIIGAGSVVTSEIPNGYIAVGIPARPIKSIEEYWKKNKNKMTYVRGFSPIEKRVFLENRFFNK